MNAPTVLILEDEDMVRESLAAYLGEAGFDPVGAASGEEALSLLAERGFDVGLVDIRLPGMNGWDFMAAAHRLRPGVPWVVFTGSKVGSLPPDFASRGIRVAQILLKPVEDLSILAQALRRAAGR